MEDLIIILFVIIIIIILLFLIYKNYYYLKLYFSSNKNYNHYRLGDMVSANNKIRNNPMGINYHLKYYPDSIASEYLRGTKKRNDYNYLYKIVKNYDKNIKPDKDLLVVHLRVGDVLNHSKYSVKEHLDKELNFERNTPRNYVKPLSYYQNIIDNHKKCLPKKVKFYAGGCFCDDKNKSYEYINAIKNLFKKEGFQVVKNKYFDNPDKDFVSMSRSKYFIKSGGSFSDLITKMIEKKEKNKLKKCSIIK